MKNFSTTSFKKYCAYLTILSFYLFAMLFNGATANAQINNIKFSSAPATYSDLSGGTSLIAGGNVAVGAATLKSAVTPIGFTFNYQGVDYTQFSAAATGMLQFGSTQVAVFDNTNILTAATPFVCAAWDWFTVGTNGGVTYQLSGTAPNQVLTVQWKVTKTANTATAYNFQVKLYEGSNKIEFLYGSGAVAAITSTTGLNNSANEHLFVNTFNEAIFTSMNITNAAWPTSGNKYVFTPRTTTSATGAVVATTANFWIKADQPVLYNRTFLNVPAASRTATTSYDATNYDPTKSVFTSTQAWLSSAGTYTALAPTESITLDLGSVQTIDGIGTMGRASTTETTTSFTVKVSSDNLNWTNLGLFLRNEDSKVLQYNDFDAPVTTRYVRVIPTDFVGSKALRLDLYTKSVVTPLMNNTAMNIWEDISGNDYDAMNVVGNATRPTYLTNQFNFNPAVNFTATTNILNNPDFYYKSMYYVSAPTLNGVPVINIATNTTLAQITGVSELAESIGYQNTTTATQQNVIETYLGTKYGISLGHDYVAADGTTKVYDLTANAGYVSNIFGIGRSDSQGLHQRQSKSVNASALLTIGNSNTIDLANGNTASSGNDIGVNNSYLLVGDNAGALDWTTSACSATGPLGILQRYWKVQETGTIGSVKVQFDTRITSGATAWLPLAYDPAQSVYLIVSNDAVFTDVGDTRVLMTYDATTKTYSANVDLANGQFFTVAASMTSPGGVSAGLQQWLKADNATIGLATGSTMSNWPDSYFDRTINKLAGTPKFQTNAINFNPTVYFDGLSSFGKSLTGANLDFASYFTSAEVFGMVKAISNTANNGFPWDYGAGAAARSTHYLYSNSNLYDGFGTTDRLGFNPVTGVIADAKTGVATIQSTFNPYDWSLYNDYSATNNWGINRNSVKVASTTNNVANFTLQANGVTIAADNTFFFNGYIPEVFVYNRVLTTTERNQVNTYMGIKYGITLSHNYIAPDGTTVLWDKTANAIYHNNIIGIGRSDCEALHQRQSKSLNTTSAITIGNNNIINTTVGNSSTAGNDIITNDSYLVVGDNNGDLKLNYTSSVNKYFFNRIWKINETGTIGSVKVSIPSYTNTAVTTLPNYYTTFFPNNKVYLAMDDDGNFQNGGTTYIEAVAAGSGATATYEVNVDLTNTKPYLAWAVDKDMTDSDGDGIVNPDDIDDDNDGILDLTEQGSCTYPENYLPDLTYTGQAVITTSGNSITALSNQNTVWKSSYSDQTFKLPIHFEYTTTGNVANSYGMIGLLPVGNTQTPANWNDGAYKIYHNGANIQGYMPQAYNFTKVYTAGQKIEIDITASGYVTVKQAGVVIRKFKGKVADYKLAISHWASAVPRTYSNVQLTSYAPNGVCADLDTDGDGVVNRLDLDSDGDGCTDAVEGGAATLNATTVPFTTVGTNGLATSLQNPANSGVITYNEIYDIYAVDNTVNACDDHDGDLILDYIDIDDDNDGVLDQEEQTSCVSPAEVMEDLTFTGNTTVAAYDTEVSGISTSGAANSGSWTSSYATKEFSLPIHMEFTTDVNNVEGMIGLAPTKDLSGNPITQVVNNYLDTTSFKYYFATASNYYAKMPTTWNVNNIVYTATQKFEIDINESGVLTATVNGVMVHRIQAPKSTYKFVVSGKTAEKWYHNFKLTSKSTATVCTDMDTDGDGVVNRLDLDSDDDGCNDAIEANVGNVTTTVPLTGAVGSNGLVDTKETAVDNGIVTYNSTYASYALSDIQNVCLDSDGDNVGNLRDLDDDNDGIPDAIEMNCSAPLFVNKTTAAGKLTGSILKETGTINYEILMSGPSVTNPGVYDGGNGIHFQVNGITTNADINFNLTSNSSETSSTPIPPKVQTVEFGPSVPVNTASTASNEASNIVLTWPGAYAVVYDPYNQLSSHNTGDVIQSGDMIVQNVAITNAQVKAGQTWKVKMYMHTSADVYNIKASIFGDNALVNEGFGFNINACSLFDTDADGLQNQLDTDSDNDGCFDSFEGNAVTNASQATVTGPYGTNGFANTLETTDDFDAQITTSYKSTITYNQAISAISNSCLDTDGDGVKDNIDIDDDNDGILDAEENTCGTAYFTIPSLTTGATANLQTLTGTATNSSATVDYEINLVGVNTVYTSPGTLETSFDNSKGGLHYSFTDNDNVYAKTYKLTPSAPTQIRKVQFGVNVPTNQINTAQVNDAQSITLTWSPDVKAVVYDPNDQLSTHATGDVITSGTVITTRANYTIAASTWRIDFLTNALGSEFFLQTSHKTTTSTNVGIEGYGIAADICFVDDTDGDGIADYLDTDSDNDGCGDAFEAGSTSTPGGVTQTIAGPYGANGLANTVETNDTQDASITYASSSYMAYSPVSSCADTDADGVPDRDDIDDDNDGILDADEYGCGVAQFVKSYVISTGLGMGYGGSFNNGNSKGTGTMSFTDLSTVTSVTDVTDASNYKVNDANTTYKFKASLAPTNGLISQVAFGPNLPGNTANAAVVNGQQSITLSWNFPVGGIVYDPNDQLSSHTDGQGINPGDVIVTRANYAVSASTWKVIIPFNYVNKQVDFTANFVGVAALSDESFGVMMNVCNKNTDPDGDKKGNAVDTDSDGDGCYDLVESHSGYYTSLSQETIVGPYGVNGYATVAETNDTKLAASNYVASKNYLDKSVKGCLDTDGDNVPNVDDIDDDNDGILDQTECPTVPPVTKFGFQPIAGTNGRQMYITNKATNVPIGKITIAPVKNIGALDTLVGNESDNSVSGHWVDGAFVNSADRVMTIKFEPVAPYTALDLKVLANEGGNGPWGFHPRSLRVDGGIAGDGIIKAIPQRYYLKEKYTVDQAITPSMRMSTAFSGMLSGSTNKVFIQVQYNAQATTATPLVLKYTWNALAGSVANENFGFQLLELNPSLNIGKCDYDNDGINDDLDSDSDNDGCPDTKEAVHGKPFASNTNYIKGPYGANGFSTLMENNDTLAATYATSGWLPKVTTSPKKDYVNELINTRCIIPFIVPAGPTTFCSPGSVILNINLNGGTAPVSYQWYKNGVAISGATANTYTATTTGDYTTLLTYADTSTVLTDPQDVTVNPAPAVPTVTVAPGTTVCLGSTATLTSSYATNNQWFQNNAAIAGATSQAYTAAASGSYKVEYTDPTTGCKSDSTTSIIVVSSLPLAPVVAITQPTCLVATGTITITPSGNAGETYSINGTTYQVSNVFTGLAAGTYTVTTKNSNGCTSAVTNAVINAQPAAAVVPTITVAPGTTICAGGATTLTASTSAAYQWFKDGSAIVGATQATYTADAAGSYTVLGTAASGCSATSNATVVTIAPTPTASIAQSITLGNTNCGTAAPVLLTATTDATTPTYTWYKDGVAISGATAITYTATTTGSYTVKITSIAGCSFTSTPSLVTTGPSVNVTSGSVCSGQTFTFTANTTGFTNPTFAWEYSANGTTGWASASGTNNAINYVASAAGFYRVIVSDVSQTITSCPSELKLFALPTASISANPTGPLCAGQSTVLTATGTVTSPTTVAGYQWLDGATPISGATAATYTSTLSGSFSAIITDSNGCQATTAPTMVTVNPLAATPVATVTAPSCSVTTGTITITSPVGSGYTYTVDGGSAQSSPVFSGLAVGTHTVVAISSNGCSSVAVSETIPAAPGALTISGTISGNATPYVATSETYSVTAVAGAVSYVWTLPNGWTGTSTSNTIIATTAAMTNNTGTITVKAVNAAGCESAPVTLNVAIKPQAIVPPAVTNYVYCQGATATAVTATPSAGGTLHWYAAATGATAPSSLVPSTTAPGTYYYYVSQTLDGVESDRTQVQVLVNPAPSTALTTVTQPSCSVSTGIIFVDSPRGSGLTYSIDGSNYTNTTGQFTNLVAGTYSVTTQNASGCVSAASSVTITAFPSSIATAVATLVQPTCNVSTGKITVTSPIQAGLTYSIDGFDYSNTNGVFNNVAPGTYPITIKNAAGCVNTASNVTIITPAALPSAPTATITQPSCTVATGTITITSPIGSGITYSIDGINYTNTTGIFTGLTPGIYTISAQGTVGCIGDSTSFIVNAQPATPNTPTVAVVNPTCSVATGTITVVSPLGTGYTYSTDGTTYTNTTGIFTGLSAANYNVTVKNGSGCTSAITATTIAAQPATPAAPTATVTQPTCSTATGTITVTSTINSGDRFSIDGVTYTNTTGIFTGITTGSYSVTVKSAAGCLSSGTSVIVNSQPVTPSAPTASVTQPTCTVATGTITVAATGITGDIYSIDGSNYQVSPIFLGVQPNTYSVTIKSSGGCISSGTSVVVNAQPASPSTPTATVTQPTCTVATGTITVTSTINAGDRFSIDGTTYTNTNGIFTGVATGVYNLTTRNTTGCISASAVVIVNAASAPPIAPTVSVTQPTCSVATGTVIITATGNSGDTYSIDGSTYQSSTTFNSVSSGNYAVTVKSAAGCVSTPTAITVNVQPVTPATPTITSSASSTVCAGTAVTLTSSASTGNQWYESGTIIPGATGQTYTTALGGSFSVVVTNVNGCSSSPSLPYVQTVNPLPTALIAEGANLGFNDCSTTSLTLTASTNGSSPTYQWYLDSTIISGATNATHIATLAGSYSVVVTAGGCSTTSAITKVTTIPTATATGSTTVCQGGGVALSTTTGLASYQWQVDTGSGFVNVPSGGTTANYTATTSGSYQVVTSTGTSCPITVTVNSLPTVTINAAPSNTICAGDSSVLTANASGSNPFTYQWMTSGVDIASATAATFTAQTPGNYSVKVTDNNGCQLITSPTTVTVNVLPAAPTTTVTQPTCSVATGTITVTSTINAGDRFSIDGVTYTNTTGIFTGVAPAMYNVTVKSAAGCVGAASIVTVNSQPVTPAAPTVTLVQTNCTSGTGTITITSTGNAGEAYSIDGTNYQVSPIFLGVLPNTYSVTIRSASGCISSATSATIASQPVTPTTPTASVIQPNCASTTGTITVTSTINSGDSFSINGSTYTNTNGIFTAVATGVYNLTAKNTAGCSSAPAIVIINAAPAPANAPSASVTQPTCTVATGTITVTPTGNSGDTYSINGTTYQSSTVFSSVASGTYNVTIKTSAGCISAATIKTIVSQSTLNCDSDGDGIIDSLDLCPTVPGFNSTGCPISSDVNATNINVPVNGSVATNDTVPAGTSYGTPVPANTNPSGGSITMNANGTYTFTGTTPGKYVYNVPVCAPGQTTNCPTTPLEITVLDPLVPTDKPVANNDTATAGYNTPTTINVLANDAAGNAGGTLNPASVSVVTPPAHGTASVDPTTGAITYTPTPGYVGPDTLTYTVCDTSVPAKCQTATVDVTVQPNGATPVTTASDDYASVVANAAGTATVSGSVIGNDANTSGATLTASVVSGPTSSQGTFTMNPNGTYTFTPAPGFSGPVNVVYQVCGGTPVSCAEATLHILVDPAPTPITPVDVNATNINVPVNGSVATNDTVPAGTSYGTPVPANTNPSGGSITMNANGTYTFTGTTPGKYVYNVPVCAPGQTTNCPTTPLEITVLDPLVPTDKPVANNDTATAGYNTPTTINVLANDAAGNAGGTLNPASVSVVTPPAHGTASVDPTTGAITYTPTPGYVGPDTLTYTVCDTSVPAKCQTATVDVTVQPNGATPVTTASDDYASVVANAAGTATVSGSVIGNDANTSGATLTASVVSGPTSSQGTFTMNPNGTYTFTPAPGFSGPVNVVYQVCGGTPVSCAEATLHILVDPAPTPITPVDVNATNINVPVNGSVATNDTVPAGTSYGTPVPANTNPSGGSITMNANGTYTFTGTTPGKYVYNVPVCAPGQTTNCPTTPLEITVLDPISMTNLPVANNDTATVISGGSVSTDVLANDKTANNGTLLNPASVAVTTLPSHGTVSVNPTTGAITYTPTPGYVGTDVLTYTVCDTSSPTPICQTAQVVYTVKPIGSNPITTAVDDYTATPGGTNVTGNVMSNDANTSGATLTASVVSGPTPSQGTFTMNPNGTYTFTPAPGFSGPVDVVYEVCGGTPVSCAKATLHILVQEPPVLIGSPIDDGVEIFNSVSPNGDGDNDVFVIRNIENYPNNTVSIYNRWGVLVYEVDGYGQNDKVFKGISEGRVTVQQSEELPEGTYFYILRYVNFAGEEKQRSGYLYIKR
jgi:gliding motility-associated-like protein